MYEMITGLDTLLQIATLTCSSHQLEHSRDIFLRLAEFLREVLGGGFAGDLDERELFAVARGVARSLTHAVLVVPLHQVR